MTGRYFKIFVPSSCQSGVHHLGVKGKFCAALVCCQKCSPTYNYNVHFSTGEMEKSNCSYYVGINTNAHCLNLSYEKPLWYMCHPSIWGIAWVYHANDYRQFACASDAESFKISLVEILFKIWSSNEYLYDVEILTISKQVFQLEIYERKRDFYSR